MRSERIPGEKAPLLKSAGGSSFQLEDDTEVIQVTSALSRKSFFEDKHSPRNSLHHWIPISGVWRLSSGGQNPRLWPRDIRMTILLFTCYVAVLIWTLIVLVGPLILAIVEKSKWCQAEDDADRYLKASGDQGGRFVNYDLSSNEKQYENPDYNTDPCRYIRIPWLVGLTLEECDYCQRMLTSVLLGAAIGFERRSSDRPAGIRTMGLVSLGACFFTISSISAFKSSTMGWDSSRVTAALPSGVGFLGAALIWKGTVNVDTQEMHQVHGLTTAASVWLSAAVGVGAGGALYFVSIYSTVLILLVLRFGPTLYLHEENQPENESPAAKSKEPEPHNPCESGEEVLRPVDFGMSQRQSIKSKRRIPTFHG